MKIKLKDSTIIELEETPYVFIFDNAEEKKQFAQLISEMSEDARKIMFYSGMSDEEAKDFIEKC
jgi:hypothetical protein